VVRRGGPVYQNEERIVKMGIKRGLVRVYLERRDATFLKLWGEKKE